MSRKKETKWEWQARRIGWIGLAAINRNAEILETNPPGLDVETIKTVTVFKRMVKL